MRPLSNQTRLCDRCKQQVSVDLICPCATGPDVVRELRENASYLQEVRELLFVAIDESFRQDPHGKSYEGTFAISLPNYWDQRGTPFPPFPNAWKLHLSCYVIGPNRHYMWEGSTLSCCIDAAKKDITDWVREFREEAARP